MYHAQIVPTVPYSIQLLETSVKTADKEVSVKLERQNVLPYSYEEKTVHFVMNQHFLQMRSSQRNVEISHWGNVYFFETYDLMNRCAHFVGEFSTLDFNRGNRDKVGRTAFVGTIIDLPISTWGFDFRDELGNITSSQVTKDKEKDQIVIGLNPRFGLLGSWNSTW